MDWTQLLAILAGNLSIMMFCIRMSRADFLHIDKKFDEHRKETNQILRAIQEEIKDFHNRLCKIEENKK